MEPQSLVKSSPKAKGQKTQLLQLLQPAKANSTATYLLSALSNQQTILTHKLVAAIKPTVDMRYNLSWAFGGFFDLIPRRLGNSEALDACVSALVSAHADYSTSRGQLTPHAIAKYSRALSILRSHLDDPVKARAADTLCAVMVLLMGQVRIPFPVSQWGSNSLSRLLLGIKGMHLQAIVKEPRKS